MLYLNSEVPRNYLFTVKTRKAFQVGWLFGCCLVRAVYTWDTNILSGLLIGGFPITIPKATLPVL